MEHVSPEIGVRSLRAVQDPYLHLVDDANHAEYPLSRVLRLALLALLAQASHRPA
jgi:hypothetical protein